MECAARVELCTLLCRSSSRNDEINVLGYVGDVIADPLDILRTKEQMRRTSNILIGTRDIIDRFLKEGRIQEVDFAIRVPNCHCPRRVPISVGSEYLPKLILCKRAHLPDARGEILRRRLAAESPCPLCNIFRQITDTLQFRPDPRRGHNVPQIDRQGLPPRNDLNRLVLDARFEDVNLPILFYDFRSGHIITGSQRVDGIDKGAVNELAHL